MVKIKVMGKVVGNLGITYEAQGHYDEAERQFFETLRLREGFWDDETVWTLSYKSFLARVYRKQKRYEEAELQYLEILPIQRRVELLRLGACPSN